MSDYWDHIGLHGHTVGTFTAKEKGIRWVSAMNTSDSALQIKKNIPATSLTSAQWTVFGRSAYLRIQSNADKSILEHRFDGFPPTDYDKLSLLFTKLYEVDLEKLSVASHGASFGLTALSNRNLVFRQCILEDADEEGEEFEPRDGHEMASMNLGEVAQCVMQGNTRNEIELQFHESDTVEPGTDQLVSVRFYIPPDPNEEEDDPDSLTSAEKLQQDITKLANIKNTAGNEIARFEESQGTFLTPRGRYQLTLFDSFLRMHGNRYDYKIKYDDISRLFLLPKPDDLHMAFVIALDKPIRQGQQLYQILVLQTNKETEEISINLDEDTLKKEYGGALQPVMQGALCNLIAKTFKIVAKKKVFVPGKFANAYQQQCVKCALRANEGHLYPLEKSFVFIHKPPVFIKFDEVQSVEFQRYAGGQGSTRNFDLCVTLEKSAGDTSAKEYIFSGIDRSDFNSLYGFLSGKKIRIVNTQEVEAVGRGVTPDRYSVDPMGDDFDDSSDDEDFGSENASSSSEDEGSDDDLNVDEDVDSDLEEARRKSKKEKSKKRSAESPVRTKTKKAKTSSSNKSAPIKKSSGKKKDPNAPKRAMTAYMYYSQEMRPRLKEDHPDFSFGELSKALGKKYSERSDQEKQKYEEMAKNDKDRYEKQMSNYEPPEPSDDSGEESKTGSGKAAAKKKAKKDPNAPKRASSSYLFYSKKMRPIFKKENPDIAFTDMGKLLGKKFKELSEEAKKEFVALAEKDKRRYEKEMKSYTPPTSVSSSSGGKKKQTKIAKKDEAVIKNNSDDSDSTSVASSLEGSSDSDDDSQ